MWITLSKLNSSDLRKFDRAVRMADAPTPSHPSTKTIFSTLIICIVGIVVKIMLNYPLHHLTNIIR
uniref:Uncharacterized protein n=1 Tax=Arundo donax TaxID=35708 RepID=A0A0A9BKN0_ARUDO